MRPYINKAFFLFMMILVSGCNGRYSSLDTSMSGCGFWTSAYSSFHSCMEEKVTANNTDDRNDYYNKSSAEIVHQLDFFGIKVAEKAMTDKEGFAGFRDFVNRKVIEEKKSSQIVGAIIAVGAVGFVAASCANNGGCGNGFAGSNSYDGNCPCPYDLDVNGNQCGARSAYSRSGGASPICY